jgi:hypothetical protein
MILTFVLFVCDHNLSNPSFVLLHGGLGFLSQRAIGTLATFHFTFAETFFLKNLLEQDVLEKAILRILAGF